MLMTEDRLRVVGLLAGHSGCHHGGHPLRGSFARAQVTRQRQLRDQQRQDQEDDGLAAEKMPTREHV